MPSSACGTDMLVQVETKIVQGYYSISISITELTLDSNEVGEKSALYGNDHQTHHLQEE